MFFARNMQEMGENQERFGFSAKAILSGQFFEELIKNLAKITPDFLARTHWGGYIDPALMYVMKAVKPLAFTEIALEGESRCRWNQNRPWTWEAPDDCVRAIRDNWCTSDIPQSKFELFKLNGQAFFAAMKPEDLRFGSERTRQFAQGGGFVAIQKLMAENNPLAKLMELKSSPTLMDDYLAQCQAYIPRSVVQSFKLEDEDEADEEGLDIEAILAALFG